ncbi:hypothetical protein M1146_08150 [Patescibacteria group bacterium]|nr:hypothetical protein [Patescibacteria group bacterium]
MIKNQSLIAEKLSTDLETHYPCINNNIYIDTIKLLLLIHFVLKINFLDSALLPEIAEMYKNNKEEFDRQAKSMTKKFATG